MKQTTSCIISLATYYVYYVPRLFSGQMCKKFRTNV